MASIPQDLKYSRDHLWCRIEGLNVTVGLAGGWKIEGAETVFVDLPQVGSSPGRSSGSVETTAGVFELFSPVDGKITEVNEELSDGPELVDHVPYGRGWLYKIQVAGSDAFSDLLTPAQYEATLTSA